MVKSQIETCKCYMKCKNGECEAECLNEKINIVQGKAKSNNLLDHLEILLADGYDLKKEH